MRYRCAEILVSADSYVTVTSANFRHCNYISPVLVVLVYEVLYL